MNTFGSKFRLTTFGESHGTCIGGVIDGYPAGIKIDLDFLQQEVNKRRGGLNIFSTPRIENDKLEIFSGIFDNKSTGAPIAFGIFNENQKSKDYENLKNIFRPGHADFTYFAKYGIRDYRGGGRSSARETAVRVAGGAFADLILQKFNIKVKSGLLSVGNIKANEPNFELNSEIFSLGLEEEMKKEILEAKKNHDSIGGCVLCVADNVPAGLGEGLYDKFDSKIASALMGINGVKAVEIGAGINSSYMLGSINNDQIDKNGFKTNNSGGILGGISNGDQIIIKCYFKPTPSIFKSQNTIDVFNNEIEFELRGRHDPCIAVRGSVVVKAMIKMIIVDLLLLNASSKIENLIKIYKKY